MSQQITGKQKVVVVIDQNGNPVTNAVVTIGEGKRVRTNSNGEFSMRSDTLIPVRIEAEGFKSQLIEASRMFSINNVVLEKADYQMGEKDNVDIPFGTIKKLRLPAAVTTLSPTEILQYDQTSVSGLINGRVPGMFGLSSIRGMDHPLIIVDGIPRPLYSINSQEIAQISVIKDLSSTMLYGSQGYNGIILINTKRGKPLERSLHFTASTGFDKPISYPKYLGSADYMELYNEALSNDGLEPNFTSEEIENTRNGVDPVRYPDESYYNSTYLKNWTTSYNVVGEAKGGNNVAQYYLNLGWRRNNSLLHLGEGDNEKLDRLNVRGNIDYKLSKIIKVRLDGAVMFNLYKGPRFTDSTEDFWSLSTKLHPEYYPVLIPTSLITDSALLNAARLIEGKYVLGGTSEHMTNMYGELTLNGPKKSNERLVQINSAIDFNLNSLTQGLKASAFLAFDMNNMFRTEIMNSYAVYEPVYFGDTVSFSKLGVDVKEDNQTVTGSSYYRRIGFYGKVDYDRTFGSHHVSATVLAYHDEFNINKTFQPGKMLNFGMRANYSFKNKYIAEFSGVVTGSSKLFYSASYAFSPSISLGWILSQENFLKDNRTINFLKLRGNWTLDNYDKPINDYFLNQDLYTRSSGYLYDQGKYYNNGQTFSMGNPNLGWEKVMNVNMGLEGRFFDYKVGVEATYFYYKLFDLVTQRSNTLPVYYPSIPYQNYESDQIQGAELGVDYDANLGNVEITLGGNFVYSMPKALTRDELDYPDAYRKRAGKPSDAIFGYVAEGLFSSQEEIDNSPYQTFGAVQPGDIKYKDLNNDNIINEDDQMMIGNSMSRVQYGLTLKIRYKAFELFVLGYGRTGQERLFTNSYYWVYGERKYSEVVLDRWTPATAATATYPRLTSKSNANNFKTSTFWMEKNNWFNLRTVQLTYTLVTKNQKVLDEFQLFARGYNLFTASKIKDKTNLNVGRSPQTRGISIGLTLLF